METSYDDYDRFRDLDNAFHAIIMRASGNEIGLTIVRVIHRHGGATAPLASGAPRAALKRTLAEHREILEALAARDGELAGERVSAAHRGPLGRAEETRSRRTHLTNGDHSYDDHSSCGSRPSTLS